jgi:hypothetical protein
MPTVADAARVTTRDNAVWRTCTTCGQLAPLPPTVNRCARCDQPAADSNDSYARSGWDRARRFAAILGRVEAWAEIIPHVSDAERLHHIGQALAELHELNKRGGQP